MCICMFIYVWVYVCVRAYVYVCIKCMETEDNYEGTFGNFFAHLFSQNTLRFYLLLLISIFSLGNM